MLWDEGCPVAGLVVVPGMMLRVTSLPLPCSQVLDSLLAQYGTVESCEQGKSGRRWRGAVVEEWVLEDFGESAPPRFP